MDKKPTTSRTTFLRWRARQRSKRVARDWKKARVGKSDGDSWLALVDDRKSEKKVVSQNFRLRDNNLTYALSKIFRTRVRCPYYIACFVEEVGFDMACCHLRID